MSSLNERLAGRACKEKRGHALRDSPDALFLLCSFVQGGAPKVPPFKSCYIR